MSRFHMLPTLALLFASASALAAEARIGALVLSIPQQFKGPVSAAPADTHRQLRTPSVVRPARLARSCKSRALRVIDRHQA